jgi:hypothetical protein
MEFRAGIILFSDGILFLHELLEEDDGAFHMFVRIFIILNEFLIYRQPVLLFNKFFCSEPHVLL